MAQSTVSIQKILLTTVNLMKSKSYVDITIKDICESADISRQTFYNHFKTKDDIFKTFFKNLSEKGDIFSPDRPAAYYFSRQYKYDIVSLYDKYSDIFFVLFEQDILWYLGREFVTSHRESIFKNISDEFIGSHQNYFYMYTYLGISQICLEWIRTGKKETKEELVDMIEYFDTYHRPKNI
ncbi:MAG: TetR/AcrR family transcriptional regulator [Oscillospiraceae bacterium]|nr:TetR/AcrR family transcriptional regulator [Oscillospiraceae bacterium]